MDIITVSGAIDQLNGQSTCAKLVVNVARPIGDDCVIRWKYHLVKTLEGDIFITEKDVMGSGIDLTTKVVDLGITSSANRQRPVMFVNKVPDPEGYDDERIEIPIDWIVAIGLEQLFE